LSHFSLYTACASVLDGLTRPGPVPRLQEDRQRPRPMPYP
jgi:hypothetical protein